MTTPIWMLLGFALWTLAVLIFTVGVYRWSRILTGRAGVKDFRADRVEGEEWYLRSMRAHANCVENLPVFAVVVFALYASGTSARAVDIMSVVVLLTRICQSVIHVGFKQTNRMALLRFIFFFIQLICFVAMAGVAIQHAAL
jgi:uncharacterized MAPEG superfamily protein